MIALETVKKTLDRFAILDLNYNNLAPQELDEYNELCLKLALTCWILGNAKKVPCKVPNCPNCKELDAIEAAVSEVVDAAIERWKLEAAEVKS